MVDIVRVYVESLIIKYFFWNRIVGVDYFFVICYDVGVCVIVKVEYLVKNFI